MAHEEMRDIKSLDVDLLQRHKHRLHLYFAEQDDWVGDNKNAIIEVFRGELDAIKVVHGRQDIPHAFCISKSFTSESYIRHFLLTYSLGIVDHGEDVAQQCHEWLVDGMFS